MQAPLPESFLYSADQITEMCETWQRFNGFEGYECGCGKKLNVFTMGPGFICPCGKFNIQMLSGGRSAFETPDYGPSIEVIREGISKSTRWQKLIKGS